MSGKRFVSSRPWYNVQGATEGDGVAIMSGFDEHGAPVLMMVRQGQVAGTPQVFSADQALILSKQLECAAIDVKRIQELVASGVVDRSILEERRILDKGDNPAVG